MNEFTLTQLKIIVERAVRPVRASASLKRNLREELLAHLTAVFEEEAARVGDEQVALEHTGQRFGNPAELTGQLQTSVTGSDRWTQFLERVFVGTGASASRLALRYTLFALVPGLALLIAFLVQGRMVEWPITVGWAILASGSIALADGLRNSLFGPAGRSWGKAALVCVASWFLIPGVTFALCLVFSGNIHSSLMDTLPLCPMALLTPAALISPACLFAVDVRSQQEWASLQID